MPDPQERSLVARVAMNGKRRERSLIRLWHFAASAFCAATGAAYLPPIGRIPPQLEIIDNIMPLWLWPILWLVASALMLAGAYSCKARRACFPFFAGLLALLTASYFAEQMDEGISRAWVSAKNYLFMLASVLAMTAISELRLGGKG